MSSKRESGYWMGNGEYAPVLELTLSYGAQVPDTTPVYSDAVEVGAKAVARLTLTVSQISANTLDVTVEVSPTGASGTWYTSGTFTQATTTGSESKLFMLDRFVRCKFDNGTNSSTSTVTGEAV